MATYSIEVSEPAENDLRDIILYISSQLSSPMTAMNMMDTIEEALLGLTEMPQKCPAVRDDRLASMGYRKLLIKNYVAFLPSMNNPKLSTLSESFMLVVIGFVFCSLSFPSATFLCRNGRVTAAAQRHQVFFIMVAAFG